MDIAKIFLNQMLQDNLDSVLAMVALGNYPMARAELQNALDKVNQLEATAKALRPAPQIGTGRPTTTTIDV